MLVFALFLGIALSLCEVATSDTNDVQQLFAVVGGNSCASSLNYGALAITEAGSTGGQYPYFLSTNTQSASIPHTDWLQVVTSDGTNELFRIYWTFPTAKTIADRFVDAYSTGEPVSYRVVTPNDGEAFSYNATWRFSSVSNIYAFQFTIQSTACCFSSNYGAWGAGADTVDGNGNSIQSNQFWGIGNFNSADSTACHVVYSQGVPNTAYTAPKAYMYYFAPLPPSSPPTPAPSAKPTITQTAAPSTVPTQPSATPTRVPTGKPTFYPSTLRPTTAPSVAVTIAGVPDTYALFAVLSAQACAETLYYGPSVNNLNAALMSLGNNFLLTNSTNNNLVHDQWLQIVTSDGSNELFRIYWTFETPRTLADHFIYAVEESVAVSFRVVTPSGTEYAYTGNWWFSSAAGNMQAVFDTTVTGAHFSVSNGVWGAGTGNVNGNSNSYVLDSFWGVGVWYSTDAQMCSWVFQQGVPVTYTKTRTFMYYSAVPDPTTLPTATPTGPSAEPTITPSVAPTFAPSTRSPTAYPTPGMGPPPDTIVMNAQQDLSSVDYNAYLSDIIKCNAAITATIVSAVGHGISSYYVKNLVVTGGTSSTNLRSGNKGLAANPLGLYYTVQIPGDWGVSYNQLSTSLTNSVASGAFTTQLQQNAYIYNALELNAATSSYVSTFDYSTTDSSSNKSVFTVGVIVGIVFGCTAALVLICFAIRCFCRKHDASTQQTSVEDTTNPVVGAPAVADPAHYSNASAPELDEAVSPAHQAPAMSVAAADTVSGADASGAGAGAGGASDKTDASSGKAASAPPTPLPRPVAAVAVPVTHEMAIAQPYDGEVDGEGDGYEG